MNPKRWPIIRHIRFFWHSYWLGMEIPNPARLYTLDKIWKGKA